jgi:predicted nucleic acid-binding protein
MGLILDTSVLITGERQGSTPKLILERIRESLGETDFSISAISVLELDHGIYRATSEIKSRARRQFSIDICNIASVVPVTLEIARLAGRIEGEQAARGIVIDLADLLIGTTAVYLGFDLLTLNPKHFRLIPTLNVLTP